MNEKYVFVLKEVFPNNNVPTFTKCMSVSQVILTQYLYINFL